ncbi:tetratricopeptide repeat protein [Serratia fonticola]|uniref:Tetratricopeptide repeat protein n=1 Tax=Serratia fonticola TaxID=47917 RepID=A0A559SZL7_SERFO|nr:cellulose biosynthesis protein BcsC [Serratia fonticola]TQI79698.1 tetratricopeptide repeat protein [Serratia fonticola]TQI98276.1 tetratricopeptide repeat protein [Serratia fonticola]TVZ67804.1 tetratricopeptide repeat protein [Serratia fonticola]
MEYHQLNLLLKKKLYGVSLAGLTVFSVSAMADDSNPALSALFQQAAYWHDKSHDELAQGALQKILLIDESNTEAMYLLSLYAMQAGDKTNAELWRKKLSAIAPNDPRLQALNSNGEAQSVSKSLLAQARQLAAKGDFAQSAAAYQAIFNGKTPIDSLANEYYLTLAGSPAGRQEAIDGLKQRLSLQPNDAQTRVVLGKVLTYQESTRRDGIAMLAALAPSNNDADQALKQALLWLAPQPSDKALYDAYQQRHPADKTVAAYYQQNITGSAKGVGFSELNKGDLSGAKDQFAAVLANNPNDGDALAGMGFTAMRSGDFSQAEAYLTQAAKQGGPQSAQWRSLAQDAAFYGGLEKAKLAANAGRWDEALALSAPLSNATGDKGNAVTLFRADVTRKKGDFAGAEQMYRGLLTQNPQNNDAKLGLYYLLLQQRDKTREADLVLQTIPVNLRPKIPQGIAVVNVDPLRKQAELAMQNNDSGRAMQLLQQALEKQPSNVWVRLDMARVLSKQGQDLQAQTLISPLIQLGASPDSLYAAALFASERNDWLNVSTLMARIPAARQTSSMRALAATAAANQQRVTAESYLRQGNTAGAAAILRQLAQKPPTEPAALGDLAKDLMTVGDTSTAVQLVRDNMRLGVKGNAGDYAAQIAVLNQAGLSQEADAWLNNPALQARSTAKELSQMRNGSVINDADKLRLQGQYSAAYDKLIGALQSDPQNPDIMLAMGRLYQSGNMDKEAGQVYNYLLNRDSLNQGAREGAVGVALSEGDVDRAKQLLRGLPAIKTPDQLVLAARVAEAEGNYPQAISLLREAKNRVNGAGGAAGSGSAMIGGLRLADNPFGASSGTVSSSQNPPSSAYGVVLPWQVAAPGLTGGYASALQPAPVVKNPTLQQIDKLMDEVQEKTATWVQGNIALRDNSSGENGLSNITEVRSPISLSGVPFDNARVNVDVTPVMLKAGTPSNSANSRFGTGALQQAKAVEAATQASIVASQNSIAAAQAADLNYQQLHATRDSLCSVDANSAACAAATVAQDQAYATKQTLDGQVTQPQTYNPNDFYADSPGQQQDTGVELALGLSGDSYKVDVGSTPLGSGISSVVGGATWSPKLSQHSTLGLTVERRAVKDSLLSYVGTEDTITGKKWGAVTKNGGSINLGYDDGVVGAYGGVGLYDYLGENVASNKSVTGNLGAYIRPYKDDENELKVGVNVNYMNFDKNLSYFTYGQGGYFSPQDYLSISLPVEFTKKQDNFTYILGASVGYQTYSNQESPYFPNDPNLQSQLEDLVSKGYGTEAKYASEDKSGIGYSLKAGGTYKVTPSMLVGGQLGYDTFGSYSESTALLYFKYLLDEK